MAVLTMVLSMATLVGVARADDAGSPALVEPLPAPTVTAPVDVAPAAPMIDAGAVLAPAAPIDAGVASPTDGGAAASSGTAVPTSPVPPQPPTLRHAPTAPATPTAAPPPLPPHAGNKSRVVIKLVLGFVLLFAIAYIGSHRKVVAAQDRLGIGGVIAAGFPFVALGVIVRQPEIGILTPDIVERMRPILHFGLGWLGFIIGAQLDTRVLDRVPRGTANLIVVEALVPFAATAAACGAVAVALGVADLQAPTFWRDLILLGAAAAMTAPRRFRGFANRGWREGRGVDQLLGQLDEIVGVVGLLFVAAYFRPAGAAGWQIPGTAWVFVTIGLGVVVGVLIFAMVRVPVTSGEFLAVVLGSVAFGSGLAGYLFLSPIVVCFVAGALVTNFPCEQRDDIFRILNHLERPIHLLFLIVAGATWNVTDPAPWAIVPVFVVARVLGKWVGVTVARTTASSIMPRGFADNRVLVSPLSPLSIALVLSLYGSAGGAASDWIITIVIGGAVLTEVGVQLTAPPVPRAVAGVDSAAHVAAAPIGADGFSVVDELDEGSGPTYVDHEPHGDEPPPPLAPRPRTKGDGT